MRALIFPFSTAFFLFLREKKFNFGIFLEFRDCFYLFARSGHIRSVDELSVIMKSLRTSPTQSELRAYLKEKNGKLAFADFLDVMHTHTKKENANKEIRAAFLAADPGRRGLISSKELKHILQGWGDKLSSREVDQIFREANVKPGSMIKYEEFIKTVCSPVPDYYF
uniref:EOG090X0GKM n=1 Tax=Lynceus sp. MCZ IZ 141354 TaxID=1930659 RepID=A0A9N6WT98_9CRUS|nr:EOG090X0GKM [Lynceus sp. MCZ IZ 141354]